MQECKAHIHIYVHVSIECMASTGLIVGNGGEPLEHRACHYLSLHCPRWPPHIHNTHSTHTLVYTAVLQNSHHKCAGDTPLLEVHTIYSSKYSNFVLSGAVKLYTHNVPNVCIQRLNLRIVPRDLQSKKVLI